MTPRALTRTGLLVFAAGAIFLCSCEHGGSSNSSIALPVVTISPASATVQTGGGLQFTATVVSPTSTTITWSVNNIIGGNSALGTIDSTGLFTAPAAIPSPASVTVKATSSAETNPSASAIVTITSPVASATVSVAPLNASAPPGASVQFTASVTGVSDPSVTWSVNGVAGGAGTTGTISTDGLFLAPTSVPSPASVVITATSQADPSQSASTTLTVAAPNTATLAVNFGPNGNTGNPNTAYYNGIFTSVSVCLPATPVCQIIPDVLVDTGSVGLRVLNSQLVQVPANELGTIKDSDGNQVEECVQFGDTSYTWGPIFLADIGVGGEKASALPIQVIGDTTFPVPNTNCLSLGPGPSLDTVQALGANGILGVGNYVRDCGLNCAAGQTFSGYPYYVCPNRVCRPVPLPISRQVGNPVAFFAQDNNGLQILLPSINSAGAPALPFTNPDGSGLVPSGQMIFGVGTQSNNGLGNAAVYALDENANFSSVTYQNISYPSGGFLDTGSNALYVSDAGTLGILDCADNPYYCPASPLALSLTVTGDNGTSANVGLNISNADLLFGNNPDFSAFSNLGGDSGTSVASDYFDLGLPFFFGRSVFVGVAGQAAPSGVTAPNGYVAF